MACLRPVRKNSAPPGPTNPIEFSDMAASWPHCSLISLIQAHFVDSDLSGRSQTFRFRARLEHNVIRPLRFGGFLLRRRTPMSRAKALTYSDSSARRHLRAEPSRYSGSDP